MALTQVDQGLLGTYAQYTGFKNRIINGAMVISQRGTSFPAPANGDYTLDRWQYISSQSAKVAITQDTSVYPVGFNSSLKATSSSAYTVGASEKFTIRQCIEGLNTTDLAWGTANAKTVTLSAWVYSSLTGTFGGSLYNYDTNYFYPFSYSIPTANTWTQISVTIAGPTSGTWLTTNTGSIEVGFSLGAGATVSGTAGTWGSTVYFSATGATQVVATSGATFYITGVQLEKGSTATSFDYRPYGTELQLCQRYYYKTIADSSYGQVGTAFLSSSTSGTAIFPFPVPMRVVASSLDWSGVATCQYASAPAISWTSASLSGQGTKNLGNASFSTGSSAGGTGLSVQIIANNNSAAYVGFNAEL